MEKKTNLDKLLYIFDRLGPCEVLAQLAEESADLAQAALKYRRTLDMDRKNPTPVSHSKARAHLVEEYGDVTLAYLVIILPRMMTDFDIDKSSLMSMPDGMQQKLDRWVKRLEEAEG